MTKTVPETSLLFLRHLKTNDSFVNWRLTAKPRLLKSLPTMNVGRSWKDCDSLVLIAGCDLRILRLPPARKLKRPSTYWQTWTRMEKSATWKWRVGPVLV